MPTQTINLNDALPAAPAGSVNIGWEGDAPSLDPSVVRNVSAHVPILVGDGGAGGAAGLVPAPAAGDAAAGKVLKADGNFDLLPAVVGFIVSSGTTGTNVGPMLAARAEGLFTRCVVVVKASDPVTDLTFRINKNGTDVFSADPTVAHAAAAGSVSVFTALTASPLPVAQDDVFSIDITSGSGSWSFTAQLE